jgi:osmoprotectant transport system ATP-binding protein
MIKVEHLCKHFGKLKAVDDISFDVDEHETLILLGTSGCGKTTTLKMLNRLIDPTSGNIFINDKNILEQQPEILRRGIGYVLQNNGLFPHYTVEENIAIVPQLLKWDKQRTQDRIAELIEKLHLSKDQLSAYPNELSGGQQQRVGLARALVADPPVLLMDEPFGALDNVTKAKIHAEFKALDELKKKTIIMVTHDVQEAFELGDRICLMDAGKIVQQGKPTELLFNPKNKFVSDFLKEQRLQLELRSVKVGDLTPQSPKGGALGQGDDESVWAILEKFKNDGNKQAEFEQLISAFYQYKQSKSQLTL